MSLTFWWFVASFPSFSSSPSEEEETSLDPGGKVTSKEGSGAGRPQKRVRRPRTRGVGAASACSDGRSYRGLCREWKSALPVPSGRTAIAGNGRTGREAVPLSLSASSWPLRRSMTPPSPESRMMVSGWDVAFCRLAQCDWANCLTLCAELVVKTWYLSPPSFSSLRFDGIDAKSSFSSGCTTASQQMEARFVPALVDTMTCRGRSGRRWSGRLERR